MGAIALVGLGFRFTRTGVAMRATADDQMAAFGMGIDIRRIFSLSWSLAAMTAAVAGIVVGIIGGNQPPAGRHRARTFPVVILGGLDSIGGALVGGVIIGMLENLAGGYIDPLLDGAAREGGRALRRARPHAHGPALRPLRHPGGRTAVTAGSPC